MKISAKICFVTTNTSVLGSGSELLWSRSALELSRLGHKVTCFVPDIPGIVPIWSQIVHHGGRIHRYAPIRRKLTEKLLYRLTGRSDQFKGILRENPDLVVIAQGCSSDGLSIAEECIEYRVPFVTISQAVRIRSWPSSSYADAIYRTFSKAKNNFFVSEGNICLYNRQLGRRLTPASVIPQEFQRSLRDEAEWPEISALKLACVARIEPYDKGQDLFLDVLVAQKWRNRALQISLIGGGIAADSFQRTIQMLGLCNQLKVVSHQSSISEIWKTHHGLVLPSREEGQSLALLEAMHHSRFCISTPVGDHGRLVRNNITGYLMNGATPEALDLALEESWENRSRLRQMGENAKHEVSSQYPKAGALVLTERLLYLIKGDAA